MTAGAAQAANGTSAVDAAATRAAAADLINAGQHKAAMDLLQRLAIRQPATDPDADYLLGTAAFRSGDLPTAAAAYRRCLAAEPGNAQARYGLAKALAAMGDHDRTQQAQGTAGRTDPSIATSRGAPVRPGSHKAAADPPAGSFAAILDLKAPDPPGPGELAGEIIWRRRPAVRSMIVPTVAPLLLLLAPLALRHVTRNLPVGGQSEAVTQLVRLITSVATLLAIGLAATSVINWLMRELVIRERRIEIWTGLFRHRHVMLWLHDLERPLIVKQDPWQLALNLGTLEITSTILPSPRRRRAAMRTGQLRFPGLPIQDAEQVAEAIWSRSLWERRHLLKNFVSNR